MPANITNELSWSDGTTIGSQMAKNHQHNLRASFQLWEKNLREKDVVSFESFEKSIKSLNDVLKVESSTKIWF